MSEGMTEISSSMNESESEAPRPKKIGRIIGLGFLFIALLVSFTLLKLPQNRITGLIQGQVQSALDPFGIYMSDQGRSLSILKGFEYSLTKPALELADQTRVELDDLTVTPKLSALLTGKMGVSASLHQGSSEVTLSALGRGDQVDVTLNLNQVDLGKMGVFAYAAGLKGSGMVSGSVHLDGSLSNPTSLNGQIDLKIKRLKLDEQNLMGFQLPNISVQEGTINIEIKSGKLSMKTVQIGKPSDDLQLSLTGDITLNRNLNSSALNLRTVFGLSDKLKQSISILDSILGSAKMQDGRYAYKITGILGAPFPVPDITK